MINKLLLSLILIQLFSSKLFSQNQGDSLFNPAVLHEIRIDFDEDNFWEILMENYLKDAPVKSTLIPKGNLDKKALIEHFTKLEDLMNKGDIEFLEGNATIDGNKIDGIGLRLKGYSSFFSVEGYKKSLKLDFDIFNDTLNYDGIQKINLNNGVADPSFQRDFISYYLLRKAGVAVPRISYAKVYLNNIYWGLYAITEQVDQQFLEKNFASGKGNLYKTIGWTELEFIDDNFESYSQSIELKTNEKSADGSDYVNFVESLNKLTGKAFSDSIQKLFYVDYYFKVLAIDIISKNWDSYMEHGRNFYLYHEPISDLFYWIPWDYNLAWDGAFGGSWGNTTECSENYSFQSEIIDSTINYSLKLDAEGLQYVSINFDEGTYEEWNSNFGNDSIITLKGSHKFIQPGIYNSQIYATYENECFLNKSEKLVFMDTSQLKCNTALTMNRPYIENDTLIERVYKRDASCCDCQWDLLCENFYNNNFDTTMNDPRYAILFNTYKTLISKLLENDEYKNRYLDIFKYILDSVFITDDITQLVFNNTNLIRDAIYSDTNYLFSINEFENDVDAICNQQLDITSINRFIKQRKEGLVKEYELLNHSAKPLEKSLVYNDIVINEFVANASDNNNKGADWIELYNNTRNILPLSNVWLSDEIDNPKKFNIPKNTVIKPDGFVVVWADNENKKNGLHANFKLSADGEELILYHNLYNSLDQLTFEAQYEDSSFARFPNGIGSFKIMEPTPNWPNGLALPTSVVVEKGSDNFVIFPNPATTHIFIKPITDYGDYTVTIYNSLGVKNIKSNANGFAEFDVSYLENGIYALSIQNGTKNYKSHIIVMH